MQSLCEYLLFHYGESDEILPYPFGPHGALHFPVRCVRECLRPELLPADARALDLGCAVGRSSFELARYCQSVVGVDASRQFISAAMTLRDRGELPYERVEEGAIRSACVARVPSDINRDRVSFLVGDAECLGDDRGPFSVVLLANLLDRLAHPRECLLQLHRLIHEGGQLVITSPYTWLEEFTSPRDWLGGFVEGGVRRFSFATLRSLLEGDFVLEEVRDMPFLIREHARKFQWGVAQATIWTRRT
jgi:putative 4-mercaptohistidine N1-methyltranferase